MRPISLLALAVTLIGCGIDEGAPPSDDETLPAHAVDDEGGTVHDPDAAGTPKAMVGFSFVDEQLAGMPQPGAWQPLAFDLAYLVEQEIDVLVSLTVTPTNPEAVGNAGLVHAHFPIVDMTPPTLEQQIAFVALVDDAMAAGQKVGVHCMAGHGRTGTMLATWFVKTGLSADDAIAHVRSLRPGSVETVAQAQAVHAYAAHLAPD